MGEPSGFGGMGSLYGEGNGMFPPFGGYSAQPQQPQGPLPTKNPFVGGQPGQQGYMFS
jgi:hypothetical protein